MQYAIIDLVNLYTDQLGQRLNDRIESTVLAGFNNRTPGPTEVTAKDDRRTLIQ